MKRNSVQFLRVCMLALLALGMGEALAKKRAARKQLEGVVNLNTGTKKQLMLLPGVGRASAKRIIAYRENKPFQTVEELMKVKGFGKKKLMKLKKYLTVSGATTLKARTAPKTAPKGPPKGAQKDAPKDASKDK